MAVVFQPYTCRSGFTPEYFAVHDFLVRINKPTVTNAGFFWGRWEWMFSLPYLDAANLDRIGTWLEDGRIVGLATYETKLGEAWFCIDPDAGAIKEEMLTYAKENLGYGGKIRILIDSLDKEMQHIALSQGFRPAQERESVAVIPIDGDKMDYVLPDGYSLVSFADEPDTKKYNRVLWRGFNHPGEPPETEEMLAVRHREHEGPHVNLDLKIAVRAPDGQFVSYCGMWYLPGTDYALVEPVATDPDFRLRGLGKAAVLEGCRRCGALGAHRAYVGSDQLFYQHIGFRLCSTGTWWNFPAET